MAHSSPRILLLHSALTCLPCAASLAQTQGPIHIVFDMHTDPINGANFAVKQPVMDQQVANANWVLDQTEPVGAKVSYSTVGEMMEYVTLQGVSGTPAAMLRRLYASGGQVGGHSHSERRQGAFFWPQNGTNATAAQVWLDNYTWVTSAIQTALAPLSEPLESIHCVRNSHIPSVESQTHALMQQYGFVIREGGVEEDYYGFYNHYIMNPFRPSAANYLVEDLNGPFMVPIMGSVIGVAGIHHNVFQDMTPPHMRRLFLQVYLNWRHADRLGLPEKVWAFGWGSHTQDYDVGEVSRAALVEMLPWLGQFVGANEPATGHTIARWSSMRDEAQAYFDWEAAHPGTSSFQFNGTQVDWSDYPYLRAVAEELHNCGWQEDLALGAGIHAYRFKRGTAVDLIVAWRDSGTSVANLSAWLGPNVRVVGAETGTLYGTSSASVALGTEPVIVSEEAPLIQLIGTPAPGQTIQLRITGAAGSPAVLALSGGSFNLPLPYYGNLLLDPTTMVIWNTGVIPGPAGFNTSIFIPNDPNLQGATVFAQGGVLHFGNASLRLTVNSATVAVP